MKAIILMALILLLAGILFAQEEVAIRRADDLHWQKQTVRMIDGSTVILWDSTTNGDWDIYAQKYNSTGVPLWPEPVTVVQKPGIQIMPLAVESSDGNVVVVWRDYPDNYSESRLWAQKLGTQGQKLWPEDGIMVFPGSVSPVEIEVLSNPNGGAYVVCKGFYQNYRVLGQSLDQSGNMVWSDQYAVLIEHASELMLESAVPDGEGGMIVNFVKTVAGSSISNLARFDAMGQSVGSFPLLAENNFPGNLYQVLKPPSSPYILYNASFGDSNYVDFQLMDNQGSLLLPTASRAHFYGSTPIPASFVLGVCPNGYLAMAWVEDTGIGEQGPIRTRLLNSTFNDVWDPPIRTASANNMANSDISLDLGNTGNIWLAWKESSSTSPIQIVRAQYISSAGLVTFPDNPLQISNTLSPIEQPYIQNTDAGCLIFWNDHSHSLNSMRVQATDSTGTMSLPAGGSIVGSVMEGKAQLKKLLPLQDSFAYLWEDQRSGEGKIYLQITDTDLVPLLTQNGLPLNHTSPKETFVDAVITPSGHIALLYIAYPGNTPVLYLQMISPTGEVLMPGYGTQVIDSVTGNSLYCLSTDGQDIYVAWRHSTSDSGPFQYSIMIQRFSNFEMMWEPGGRLLYNAGTNYVRGIGLTGRYLRYALDNYDLNRDFSYVIRFTTEGAAEPGWPSQGVNLTGSLYSQIQNASHAGMLGENLAVVIGTQNNYETYVRAQLVSPAGQILWNPTGVLLETSTAETSVQSVDFSDVLSVLYTASDNGPKLRLQKIHPGGYTMCGPNGTTLKNLTWPTYETCLSSFSSGWITASWAEGPDIAADIMQRWVCPSGAADGNEANTLCGVYRKQAHPQAATSGNVACVAWDDGRAGGSSGNELYSIYAARLTPDGLPASDDTTPPSLEAIHLHQNYPNPFNPSTRIGFSLNLPAITDLKIYNARGQLVRTLLDRTAIASGEHTVVWDGKDDAGAIVSSGIYFYRLSGGGKSITRRMLLMK